MRAPLTPLVAAVLAAASPLRAQLVRDTPAVPTCAEDLDAMRQKVEANYAGFLLEVRPQPVRRRAYDSTFASLRAAAQAPDVDCLLVLDRFARWFDDPHLFVYQSQRLDTAEATRRARRVRVVSLDERAARAALEGRAGELVPQFDSLVTRPARDADGEGDSVIVGPRRVGVLVDGGTVSAVEVLVLEAKRSRRATVFGEPTAGALDYQSVNVVALLPTERRWSLGYPTITASAALPRGGMRGTGIAPDVRLDVGGGWTAIAAVDRALR